ncbi:hypothetical protein AADC60_07980 [Cytobacillus pseudoceanisediminis]|uniref:Uncharacterized protein n=1 Tax=Cytobacillus pseudoceanisediminis TaxID=3051614 RepID=A0ABZ2ZQK2_9BACI
MKSAVSNSTALIAFGNVGKLEILREIYGEIYVPSAVNREVKTVDLPNWIKKVNIKSHASYDFLTNQNGLHPGESEAIILADELHRLYGVKALLLDENMARSIAKKMFKNQKYPKIHSVVHTSKIAEKKGLVRSHVSLVMELWRNGYEPTAEDKIALFKAGFK